MEKVRIVVAKFRLSCRFVGSKGGKVLLRGLDSLHQFISQLPSRTTLFVAGFFLILSGFLLLGGNAHTSVSDQNNSRAIENTEPLVSLAPANHKPQLTIFTKSQPEHDAGTSSVEQALIREFADEEGLQPNWITVSGPEQLQHLLAGHEGDVIVTNTESLLKGDTGEMRYTFPWGISRQQVVGRVDTARINNVEDLFTRQIAIKASNPAWPLIDEVAGKNFAMDVIAVPEKTNTETILQYVNSGQYDVAVLDSVSLETVLPKYLDLEAVFNLTDNKFMVWALKTEAVDLHAALNQFLYRKHLQLNVAKFYREDLPALKQRKVLRLITYPSAVNYFLNNGKLSGFEYELARRFASKNKMRLDVVIADNHETMRTMLLQGQGDMIAASLPMHSYTESEKINYTEPYHYAAPVVVGRMLDYPLYDIRDLHGRQVILSAESPYKPFLERIKQSGIDVEILIAEPGINTEATLSRVAKGIYDLTVVGSHQIKSEIIQHVNLKAHFALTEPLPHSWIVRQSDVRLYAALNTFIKKEYRMSFYNVLSAKYIEEPIAHKGSMRLLTGIDSLSPYDEIVQEYAEQYSFDWRLIVAQMYQESRFNPKATSYAGAEGLMQLIPETAELLGVTDVNDPVSSIRGGIRYLAYLRDRFEDDLLMEDRTWFSLAAYNAGYNRVKRARKLAVKLSLDENRWFDNVEKAMLILSRPYRKNGAIVRYCRCGQTTNYIREIKTLYNNYVRLTQASRLAYSEPASPGKDG